MYILLNKIYVLDTNVILSDPNAIFAFQGNLIIIPSIVIQEIDSKKRLMNDLGANARKFSRMINDFCEKGNLQEGIWIDDKTMLQAEIMPMESEVYDTFQDRSADTMIVALCKKIKLDECENVVLVTKDILCRVKANIVGIKAEDYENDKVVACEDDLYRGYQEVYVDNHVINEYYASRSTELSDHKFQENEFVILKSFDEKQSAITVHKNKKLVSLFNFQKEVWGILPKNSGQRMAMELLLDPNIPLVTIAGQAGTGKTLISLACALKQTLDDNRYNKILVARPVVPMGKDIGYLPGDMGEKLRPWMQPIYDNLEFLFNCKNSSDLDKILVGMSKEVQVEALTYIRGRSIPNQFIIIDEAQNLSKHEVKTIITRVGEGSKIVLLGDTKQIDHPYLDQYNNGLTYAIEQLKTLNLSGHITLKKGERSTLAQLAADLL